jgi:hypothetical protein
MAWLRPGWLVVLFAAVIAVSGWLPWRTMVIGGHGHASAIGGATGDLSAPVKFDAGQLIVLLASTLIVAGAMTAQGLSARMSAVAALVLSLSIGGLIFVYYRQKITPEIEVGFGLYIGAAATGLAALCSIWALLAALAAGRAPR